MSAAIVPRVLGRYALYGEIASGGMATVHLGRLLGPVGFSRTVAIKRLHAQLAREPDFVAMFMDEARLAARIAHPNVVPMLDVVMLEDELFLVMEYVDGESLARLLRLSDERSLRVPLSIVASVMTGVLHGLHAAHEAKSDHGEPLGIVHRDISPHNILVGADGVPRLLDFGIAKAAGRIHTTREGQLKGKLPYMAPEQIRGNADRRSDIYSCGVVLWELLAKRRLFKGDEASVLAAVLSDAIEPPSRYAPEVPEALDELALQALNRDPERRFSTAREMAEALERATALASATVVREWLEELAGAHLAGRRRQLSEIESGPTVVQAVARGGATPKVPAQLSPRALGGKRALLLASLLGLAGLLLTLVWRSTSAAPETAPAARASGTASAPSRALVTSTEPSRDATPRHATTAVAASSVARPEQSPSASRRPDRLPAPRPAKASTTNRLEQVIDRRR